MIDHEGTAMEHLALHVDVHREDGSYWAEVRELPGCFASGDTVTELVESVEEAVALYLAPPDAEEAPTVAIELAGFDLSLESDKPLQAA
jgi:predicted RNase H-like HicB family nuclease